MESIDPKRRGLESHLLVEHHHILVLVSSQDLHIYWALSLSVLCVAGGGLTE